MNPRRFIMLWPCGVILLLCALSPGCMDDQGNRITLQQWMSKPQNPPKQDRPPKPAEDEPGRPSDHAERRSVAASNDARAAEPPSPGAVHSDSLLVNNETISVNDVLEPVSTELEKLRNELPPDLYVIRAGEMIRQQIIEAVAELLVWRRAQQMINEDMEKGLKKAIEKMEKDRINREFQGRETLYDKYVAKHGKTRDQVRERLRRSIVIDSYLRERLLPLVPAPRKQELLDYYNANLAEFSQAGRREMFLIDVPAAAFLERRKSPSEADLEAATQKARALIDEAAAALQAGQPFEEAAKKYSRGVNAERGGAWGYIERPLTGRWEVPSKKLFEMKEGEVSEVIEAAASFFIVKAGKIEEGKTLTFDDAQPQIANTLRQRRFGKLRAEFLQEELRKSTIGSLDEFVAEVLRAIPQPQRPSR